MAPGGFRFERFQLDPANRRLSRDGVAVDLNARYLDALTLLVEARGGLVSKARFMDEVWRGVPVTDEALTQCVRTLRRQLGDDAARPRFIETVPKHGYRFVAPVEADEADIPADEKAAPAPGPEAVAGTAWPWTRFLRLGGAGTLGAVLAGAVGGLVYGAVGASDALHPAMGATSVILVLVCVTALVALAGGAGVSFGVAAGFAVRRPGQWAVAGGAAGGLLVGALVKLLGLDAFNLLFGQSPGPITGAPEGALLGGAVGLGAWLAHRRPAPSPGRSIAIAGALGAAAGVLIGLLGGRLMGGSLDLLAGQFPSSRLHLGPVGALFGEDGFGRLARIVTGGAEGLLFAACIVGAMLLAGRLADRPD
jgi:DNA-binding winged helix-turn-helix (wHTH) protein